MATQIIAHRTCPLDAPDNSISGIRKAAEFRADGVETDVRQTLDRRPVLMHDWTPWRTAPFPGPVLFYPSFVLRLVYLRGSKERIPLLSEALDALPDGMFMSMELKDASTAPRALSLIRERRLEERVKMWSYKESAVRYFAREAPEIESSLLRDDTDPEGLVNYLDDAVEFGARGISPHWDAINPQFVGQAHERGLKVYSMNRDLETVQKKVLAGLDGIVTDHPREVRAMIEVPLDTAPSAATRPAGAPGDAG